MVEGIGDRIRQDIEEGHWPTMSDLAMSDPAAKKSKESSTTIPKWAAIILGLGVIIGILVLITVGVKLYGNEAHIKAVEAQNEMLKQTQYEALNQLKSQRELFDRELESLSKQLAEAKKQLAQAKNDAITEANQALEAHRAEVESALKSPAVKKSHRPQALNRAGV